MASNLNGNNKSPLDAAQKIVAELTGMTAEHQSLALKFATETLGLNLPSVPQQATIQPSQHSEAPRPEAESVSHSTDIRSFTEIKSPRSDQQFTAVVAYFYQFEAKPEEQKDVIDAETMKEAARLAGRPQVERWNMTLTNAKNAGYLDGDGAGKYKLSSVGENLVAISLPDDTKPVRAKRKKPVKKAGKKTAKKTAKKTTKKKKTK